MYKVLHDGKQLLYINQPFTIELFKLINISLSTPSYGINLISGGSGE